MKIEGKQIQISGSLLEVKSAQIKLGVGAMPAVVQTTIFSGIGNVYFAIFFSNDRNLYI